MAAASAERDTSHCRGLGKSYPVEDGLLRALDGLSLTAERGRITCILGPSGCGKSTLLRLVGGLEAPDEGSVEIFGETPDQALERKRTAFLFQTPALLPWRTLERNVSLATELGASAGLTPHEALARVGLGEYQKLYPAQLSGGMQQRGALARALATAPELLLMDEPFSALDELVREDLQALIRELAIDDDIAIFFVTHNITEAVYLADQIVVMSARPGRVLAAIEVGDDGPRPPVYRYSQRASEIAIEVREMLQ